MLGKTAGGLFWMFRALERSENTARLVEAGFRFTLTNSASSQDEWASVVGTSGDLATYRAKNDGFETVRVIAFLLRDRDNPSSVLSLVEQARNNARMVRTALTREVWEAVNESWITLSEALSERTADRDLPAVLGLIRRQSALVRGATHGTMMRTEAFDFARIGTFLERADNTARILDMKYHLLLPSVAHVGSTLDNVQWEAILDSVAARGAYRRHVHAAPTPRGIADFLINDLRLPRSLAFCIDKVGANLRYLEPEHGRLPCHEAADALRHRLSAMTIDEVFDRGLHETIEGIIKENNALARQIETDFRFSG